MEFGIEKGDKIKFVGEIEILNIIYLKYNRLFSYSMLIALKKRGLVVKGGEWRLKT